MRSLLVAASAVATFAVLYGCKQATPTSVAPLYDSAPVETRNIEVTVDASGAIEPESLVEVKSKASGEVLAVHAEIGDVVQKNTMLIEIDKRTPKNNVAQNEAALAAAKARGVTLGGPELAKARKSAVASIKALADQHAANVLPVIREIRRTGAASLHQIADALNARGITTARGGRWYASSVRNVLARA